MDFNELLTREAHEAGAEIDIIHPVTGEKTDIKIRVLGPDSKEWRRVIKSDTRRLYEQAAKGNKITEDDLVNSDIDNLVSVTIGWSGLSKDGEEYLFTPEVCRKLYEDSPRIMDQVNRFIGDVRNFTKG